VSGYKLFVIIQIHLVLVRLELVISAENRNGNVVEEAVVGWMMNFLYHVEDMNKGE
jgi:hypothetical protein